MNLGLPGFRVQGLNGCSVTDTADHIEKTGMGVMGGKKEAPALGLRDGGWGRLRGCEEDVEENT